MSGSSWPVLLGLIALIAGAVWFDAQQGSTASAETQAASHGEMQAAAAVK